MDFTKPVKTDCSSCRIDLTLDPRLGQATARIPSNGRRGALHRPAHEQTAELSRDDDLIIWDCPACGYADSYDLTA